MNKLLNQGRGGGGREGGGDGGRAGGRGEGGKGGGGRGEEEPAGFQLRGTCKLRISRLMAPTCR